MRCRWNISKSVHSIYEISELKKQILELKQTTGLNLQPTLTRLEQAKSCPRGILTI